MLTRRRLLIGSTAGVTVLGTGSWIGQAVAGQQFEVTKSDAEWRKLLTPDQYVVLRHDATERPFSSLLDKEKHRGTFSCRPTHTGWTSTPTVKAW